MKLRQQLYVPMSRRLLVVFNFCNWPISALIIIIIITFTMIISPILQNTKDIINYNYDLKEYGCPKTLFSFQVLLMLIEFCRSDNCFPCKLNNQTKSNQFFYFSSIPIWLPIMYLYIHYYIINIIICVQSLNHLN